MQVVVCINSPFLFIAEYYPSYGCTSLLNHSPLEGCFCGFQVLAITNKTAMNNHAHVLGGGGEGRSFYFSGINALECHCWILWYVYAFFCRKQPNYFPEWVYYITFPSAISKRSSFSTSWPAFSVVTCKILVILVGVLC